MKLYNTMTRQLEELRPLSRERVTLYTCGLTVYSQPHIGNWLAYIYWDVLVRTLRESGYTPERTQNITDVGHLVSDDDGGEDKMQKGARQEGIAAWDVAKKYAEIADHEAYDLLGLLRPDHVVYATECIDAQIAFAEALDKKGYLYRTDDGMYFDTSRIDDYGKLARLDASGLRAGARVSVAGKKNPTDFAVWKFSPADAQRDMEWDSPWGKGFPGWHLECSVIARDTLGDQIDIHTGGIDHIPVHHTNEIAQTESLTGMPFASMWLHNNHIKIDGQKISKSLGNTYTLDDIVARGYSLDAFKLVVLSKHYRTEGNFSWEILDSAANRLDNWQSVAVLRHQSHSTVQSRDTEARETVITAIETAKSTILEALQHDLDTPRVLKAIDELFSVVETTRVTDIDSMSLRSFLEFVDRVLGTRLCQSTTDISDELKALILERTRAREAKDWQRSDALRDELLAHHIQVRDTSAGSVWSYATNPRQST